VYLVEEAKELFEFKKFMKPGEISIFVTKNLDTKGLETFAATTIKEVFHAKNQSEKHYCYRRFARSNRVCR